MKKMLPHISMLGLVTGIAILAVGAPLAGAGTCADGYCFDAMSGADATGVVADGIIDDYWRGRQSGPTATPSVIDSSLGASVRTTRTSLATSDAFDWGDFGIGIGVAFGSMLVLTSVGLGVRESARSRSTSSTEIA